MTGNQYYAINDTYLSIVFSGIYHGNIDTQRSYKNWNRQPCESLTVVTWLSQSCHVKFYCHIVLLVMYDCSIHNNNIRWSVTLDQCSPFFKYQGCRLQINSQHRFSSILFLFHRFMSSLNYKHLCMLNWCEIYDVAVNEQTYWQHFRLRLEQKLTSL